MVPDQLVLVLLLPLMLLLLLLPLMLLLLLQVRRTQGAHIPACMCYSDPPLSAPEYQQ
jgi:hypothetical protein